METYFNIRYEFDRTQVLDSIDAQIKSGRANYVCVSDGVVLNHTQKDSSYLQAVNGGMFSICDSGFVPLYIKMLYGREYYQYTGSHIFMDIVTEKKYRMMFLGGDQKTLDGLKKEMSKINPDIDNMSFVELPFADVDGFDYEGIAKMVEEDGADIIWVALGAPKQEKFMARLKPFLKKGVMIAVGAVFKFFSGQKIRRAPQWMISCHLEFAFRILQEPKKQIRRCLDIVYSLPKMFISEYRTKLANEKGIVIQTPVAVSSFESSRTGSTQLPSLTPQFK